MRIDHLVYAATDLEGATKRFEDELGIAATGGGRHEGHGTTNRILPLGGGYLEVVGIADAGEAAGSDFGRGVLQRQIDHGDGWAAWAVAVDEIAPIADRLGTPVITLRRAGLSARLTGVTPSMREPFLPFFVCRDPGVPDPGAAGSAGGITGIELSGDAERLERWLGGAALPVEVVEGPPAVLSARVGGRTLRRAQKRRKAPHSQGLP